MKKPDREEYLRVLQWHGLIDCDFYAMEKMPEAVREAFDQIARLARHHSSFNESLPEEFLQPLRRYESGEAEQVDWFEDITSRTLFVSDFLDYLKIMESRIS